MFSICIWYAGLNEGERKAIDRIIKISSKVVGIELSSLDAIFEKRAEKTADKIFKIKHMFSLTSSNFFPLGEDMLYLKPNRFRNNFIPTTIIVAEQESLLINCIYSFMQF